jgi:hypothetical protein|tara:strand:- start:1655 stop:2500 length:846 start_codon:yes stop_codon:yes gene_type:complete
MAETIRYDTSDDPVVAQSIAEKEAESLKIGEELMSKQDKMLAGKYKSAEDLEAAYLELQKKLGDAPVTENIEPTTETEYQLYTDDGNVNYDTANELYGEQLGNLFKSNEIDPFEMSKHFEENNGTLSDDMYDKLATAGLNKEIVDNYLAGVKGQLGTEPQQPVLSDAEVKDLKNIAGGEQEYEQLMNWAGNNLTEQDAKSYDEVLATGNKAAISFAVKALMGQYEDANGRDSNIVTGKESSTENYRSMAEVVRDMNKPEYQTDEAFRDDVIRKLAQSNLKV